LFQFFDERVTKEQSKVRRWLLLGEIVSSKIVVFNGETNNENLLFLSSIHKIIKKP
jgi:hypothetical protein